MTGTQIRNLCIWENSIPDKNAKLIEEILQLYDNYHKKYLEYPDEYRRLLEEKEALKLTKPKTISARLLREYPKNFIYEYETREKLRLSLKGLSYETLKRYLEIAEDLKLNYVFNSIAAFISDAKILIKNAKDKKAAKEAPLPDYLKDNYSFI